MSKRFAFFYGRVSTEDQQDPASSRQWQLSRSRSLIEPQGGEIVAEFFDIGQTRALPWRRRKQASALLDTFQDSARGFEAVVIGEPARAFYGNQFGLTFPLFVHYDVELWVPEIGGRVDPGSEAHEMIMTLYGGMSKGERNRIKIRVRTSMTAQATNEGRYLGGRPPYGYRLEDAGPHRNPGKAALGLRAHRLVVDAATAAVVNRIFRDYLSGQGMTMIANQLNRERIPCPSAHDRSRNAHRSGEAWVAPTVEAILRNPRYTGFEAWNKQRKEEVLIDVNDVALGHQTRLRWNTRDSWIISPKQMHEAIVDEDLFKQTQIAMQARRHRATYSAMTGPRAERRSQRHYALRGVLSCGRCGRIMEGSWNHHRSHYRCKLKAADTDLARTGHPRTVYVREDKILPHLDAWLDDLFSPSRRQKTVDLLLAAAEDPALEARRQALREQVTVCEGKLRRYREALEAGTDPVMIAEWTREITAERAGLELALVDLDPSTRVTRSDLLKAVEQLSTVSQMLKKKAEPQDRCDLYVQLGLHLSYEDENRLILHLWMPGRVPE